MVFAYRIVVTLLILVATIHTCAAQPPVSCGRAVHCTANGPGQRDTCVMLDGDKWIFDVSSPDHPQGDRVYLLTRVTTLILAQRYYTGECFYGDGTGGEFKAMTKERHSVTAYYSESDEWSQLNPDEMFCDPFNHPCLFNVVYQA
jgi:hypothetical protein